MRSSRMKWTSQFGLTVLALALMPLTTVGQGTVQNVKATCGAASPAWVGYGNWTTISLSATATAPTPDEGSTLQGPNWNWSVFKVESSDDGIFFTTGQNYQTELNNQTSANASLLAKFYDGKYWRITCQVTVGYSETPGGTTWTGTATGVSNPNSGMLMSITVTSGATQTNVTQVGYPNWAAVKTAGDTVVIQATVQPNTVDVANMIKWTGGIPVAGDNLQSTVDKGTSAMTAVTAQIGTASGDEVDIWIIWATVTIQIAGNIANDNNAK